MIEWNLTMLLVLAWSVVVLLDRGIWSPVHDPPRRGLAHRHLLYPCRRWSRARGLVSLARR